MPIIAHTRQVDPPQMGGCTAVETLPFEKPAECERLAWLAWIPMLATGSYYVLPEGLQEHLLVQFVPQLLGYLCLFLWWTSNDCVIERLGLATKQLLGGLRWGSLTGGGLGAWNLCVILLGIPWLGGEIDFLKETPHAQMPLWAMVPWTILMIACLVELNFRGFLLGRLAIVLQTCRWAHEENEQKASTRVVLAIGLSALTFAFDPFMVATFRHLHWIAVWDGLIWGWIYMRTRNLYTVIIAHAVEVVVLYLGVRAVLV